MHRLHGFAGRVMTILLSSAVLAFAQASAAARLPEVRSERSHSNIPQWAVRTPETDESYLYFVGRATGATTLEAAENDAAADVVRQIVSSLGLEASFDYDRVRSEADLLLKDQLELSGENRIVGLKRLETYYEKQTVTEENSVNNSWSAQVLARYPVESFNNETARMEQLSRTRVSSAENMLADARRMDSSGLPDVAWNRLSQGLDLTGSVGLLADPSTSSRLAVVRQQLIERARKLSFRLRKLTVARPGAKSPGEDGGQLTVRALETALFRKGFMIERETEAAVAGALPVVHLELSEDHSYEIEPGFHFSLWSAAISICEPGDGSVMFGDTFSVKGFGIDSERAALDAIRKLRVESFETFAERAREYYEYKYPGEHGSEAARAY